MIVVDGCTSRVLASALRDGELPISRPSPAAGTRASTASRSIPITPAATASIVGGRYPAAHGIAGMSWWNPMTGDASYFGDDVRTVLQRGLGDFLRGFLLRLNDERLHWRSRPAPTPGASRC